MVPQLVKHHHMQMFPCLDRVSMVSPPGWRRQDGSACLSPTQVQTPILFSFWNGGEDRFSRDNFHGLILTNTGGCAPIGIDRRTLKECICIGGESLVPSVV